jgi:DNA-binding NarL/FixJ family response regulator
MAPLRVVIIEDDTRYRSSLEQLFSRAAGFTLAAGFPAATHAVRLAETAVGRLEPPPWDLVLMDIEMPAMNGIEATRRLKAALPGLKVVVLTVFEQPATILEAICAGADGYLLKKSRANELLEGLRAVAEGGSPLTPNVARSLLDLVRASRPGAAGGGATEPTRLDMTEREQQVLRALTEGLSYKQAADVLGITLGTVRTHITSIYRKLQVHSVAEAVSRAVRERLV